MLVLLIKMANNSYKKAGIRSQVFYELDNFNKKIDQLQTKSIKSVYWFAENEMKEMPVKDFVTLAEENNYWES